MRTLRWVVGGAIAALAIVGFLVGFCVVIMLASKVSPILGFGLLVASVGGMLGWLLDDGAREVERLNERPHYPDGSHE